MGTEGVQVSKQENVKQVASAGFIPATGDSITERYNILLSLIKDFVCLS